MDHKKEITLRFGFLAVVVLFFIFSSLYFYTHNKESTQTKQGSTTTTEPTKTDFGANLPTDFPTNIPVEQGVEVKQSFSLDYANQKQLTIVFPTTKTVKQNYTLYADFLTKDGWTITNKYESENVSSLYGQKGSNDINVTITKEQVSMSVLKK